MGIIISNAAAEHCGSRIVPQAVYPKTAIMRWATPAAATSCSRESQGGSIL